MGKNVYVIPNNKQWASFQSIVTFQLYHGILLGVNLDIQNLLLSYYFGGSSTGHLQ
jgi:hypothetical protein